ncbi:hypothetical protein RDABS01_029460 [Bienertia sinuspersici]
MAKKQMTTKHPLPSLDNAITVNEKQPDEKRNGGSVVDRELERQIAAVRAIADARVEHLLTWLRLIRSQFNDEQLKMPVLQFFKENLPNVSLIRGENGQFDLSWKDENGDFTMVDTVGRDVHTSLLQQVGMAYPSFSDTRQSFGGFQFSAKSMKNFPCVDDPQFGAYLSQGSFNNGMPEGFQTPGAESQRLSIGMTPKTLRLPKQGEMLLSVHGSPLGVYKEESMEAIHETETEEG